jgi:sugar (pentulose or hexulose) kinase
MRGAMAVFDLGKTNSKLLVFGGDGAILHEARSVPVWLERQEARVLDAEALWGWMQAALAAVDLPLSGLMLTTHGCTFALVGKDELAAPILDYEVPTPSAVSAEFDRVASPFAETLSPPLPGGLNFGRHLYWRHVGCPALMDRVEAILCYPQYWNWRFAGKRVSEVSYLGCHSHLWAPAKRDFSGFVARCGWRAKFPPFARAGSLLGTMRLGETELPVHTGVHDSNAALHFYRSLGYRAFTLVSTGTWVIVFNGECPLEALDPARDMLANVTVDGEPIATARFMGGREFDVVSGRAREEIPLEAVRSAMAKGQFALPSFAPGGPFPGRDSRFVGPAPADATERAAVATLYIVSMTMTLLELLRSGNTIIVDGGLARNPLYLGLLAALLPGREIVQNPNAEGTASGAAALAWEGQGGCAGFSDPCRAVARLQVPGLDEYHRRWRDLVAGSAEVAG